MEHLVAIPIFDEIENQQQEPLLERILSRNPQMRAIFDADLAIGGQLECYRTMSRLICRLDLNRPGPVYDMFGDVIDAVFVGGTWQGRASITLMIAALCDDKEDFKQAVQLSEHPVLVPYFAALYSVFKGPLDDIYPARLTYEDAATAYKLSAKCVSCGIKHGLWMRVPQTAESFLMGMD